MRILALEASSTSAKAALFDSASQQLSVVTRPFQDEAADPALRDADAVVAQVLDLGRAHLAANAVEPADVALVTLCATWHGLTLQTPDGDSVTPVYGWSYTGASDVEQRLQAEAGLALWCYQRTGCPLSGSFPAVKLLALAEAGLDLSSGLMMDEGSVLFQRLTGKRTTTASLASGTGLLNLRTGHWDHRVVDVLGLDGLRLPQFARPTETAPLRHRAATMLGLTAGTPVLAPQPDGGLSQLGDDATVPAIMTASLGTSGALRLSVPTPTLGLAHRTWCYRSPTGWLAGAATSGCGNETERARDMLFDSADPAAVEPRLRPGARDVPTFLPFHFGERSPGWHSRRQAGFVGPLEAYDDVDRYQAVLQGVTFNLRQGFDELVDLVGQPICVRLSGGVLESPFWTQLTADVLGVDLELSPQRHASITGAIRLGLAALDEPSATLDLSDAASPTVSPDPKLADYYQERYAAYLQAYERTSPR